MVTAKSKQSKRKGKKKLIRSNAPKLPGWRGQRRDGSAMFPGSEIQGEELAFIKAMDQLKKHKPFPTLRDVLGVVKSLGYIRVVQA